MFWGILICEPTGINIDEKDTILGLEVEIIHHKVTHKIEKLNYHIYPQILL